MVLTQRNQLEWERPGSPVVVGLFHDLCKLEAYEPVITERTRTVVKYGWQHRDSRDQLYAGHGDKSVLMLAPWMQLTEEEVRYKWPVFAGIWALLMIRDNGAITPPQFAGSLMCYGHTTPT